MNNIQSRSTGAGAAGVPMYARASQPTYTRSPLTSRSECDDQRKSRSSSRALDARPTRPVAHAPVSGFGRICAVLLATLGTVTSAVISVVAGWDRGGQMTERCAWVFVGVVLLLSAHLIPALARSLPTVSKSVAMGLWLGAMIATGYGHATFFVLAQQHAGEVRARGIGDLHPQISQPLIGARNPTAIAADQAKVQHDLAVANAQTCRDRCSYLTVRRDSLNARLTALGVEMDEARRHERAADRVVADQARANSERDQAKADPVTSLASQIFHVPIETINLAVALSFGWLLESVSCLAWLLAIPRRNASPGGSSEGVMAVESQVTRESNEADGESNGPVSPVTPRRVESHAPNSPGLWTVGLVTPAANEPTAVSGEPVKTAPEVVVTATPMTDRDRLAIAVAAGDLKPTVAAIRKYFRCSQARAQEIRREFLQSQEQETTQSGAVDWTPLSGASVTG